MFLQFDFWSKAAQLQNSVMNFSPLPLLIPFHLCYFFPFPLFQGKQPALMSNSAAEPCLIISYRDPSSLHSLHFLLFSADTTSLRGGLWFTEHTIPLIISEIILCLPSADLESDRSKLFFLILKYRFLYSTVRFFEPCTNQIWWQLMIYSRVLENFCPLTVDAKTGTGNY